MNVGSYVSSRNAWTSSLWFYPQLYCAAETLPLPPLLHCSNCHLSLLEKESEMEIKVAGGSVFSIIVFDETF